MEDLDVVTISAIQCFSFFFLYRKYWNVGKQHFVNPANLLIEVLHYGDNIVFYDVVLSVSPEKTLGSYWRKKERKEEGLFRKEVERQTVGTITQLLSLL